MSVHSVDWEKIEWKEVRQGIERKAFTGAGATLALHRIWPGHAPEPHSHPHEQIVYMIEGQIDFYVGDQVVPLAPGGVLLIPPNVVHDIRVTGSQPVINLAIFTPARPEYVA